ncbi:PREDICTED: uncharacterized protein LOC106741127 isoform X9 [Dinoponera quadriceps]|uniref:Uncharacterized protein LOC106741127 isoform X9 n=1 Tax=Dinoponera quadriceps TaxID=609295 RepID=A0A6P3WR13_DINQU|nr:PREDICTED: uncharacterized protein LOC106741127 isoform X9 [Dinoponera quadriceps]
MVAAVSDVGLQVLRFMNFAPRSPGTFSEGLSRLFGVAHTDLNRQEKLLLARDPEAAFRIRPRRALRFTVLRKFQDCQTFRELSELRFDLGIG